MIAVETEKPELGVNGLSPKGAPPTAMLPKLFEEELLNPNAGDEEKDVK